MKNTQQTQPSSDSEPLSQKKHFRSNLDALIIFKARPCSTVTLIGLVI